MIQPVNLSHDGILDGLPLRPLAIEISDDSQYGGNQSNRNLHRHAEKPVSCRRRRLPDVSDDQAAIFGAGETIGKIVDGGLELGHRLRQLNDISDGEIPRCRIIDIHGNGIGHIKGYRIGYGKENRDGRRNSIGR